MRAGRTGIAIAGLLASGAAFAGTPGWSVSETSGQVSVVSTGFVKAASRGGAVQVGDVVSTGRTGRAVLVRGEEYLVVAPNSRIRVADPAKAGGLVQIVENFGNVIYKIKKMTMPHFAVQTPFLAAVVKGTTFSVTVTDKGSSVQVIEGKVEVATRDGGASHLVLPGDIGSVSATAPGRLNVQGNVPQTLDSPTPRAAAAAVTASLSDDKAANADAGRVRLDGVIASDVGEGPVRLDMLSGGLVSGDSALVAVAATNTPTGRTSASLPVQATATTVTTPAAAAPVATVAALPAAAGATMQGPVVLGTDPATTAPVVAVATPAPTPVAPAAPAVAAAAPVVAAAAPVVAAAAPVVVAAAPVVAAAAPVVAAAAPVVVAAAPVVAAAAPVVAAAAPVVAAAAPVVVAAAPVVAATPAATVAPAVVTHPPVTIASVVAAVTQAIQNSNSGSNNSGSNNRGSNNNGNSGNNNGGNRFGLLNGKN